MESTALATNLQLRLNPNPNLAAPLPSTSPSLRLYRRRRPLSRLRISCSAAAGGIAPTTIPDVPRRRLRRLTDEFRSLPESLDRVKRLLAYAADLPTSPEPLHLPANRVMGCTAQVWLSAAVDALGRMRFAADSDSEITKGFCACLIKVLDGALPEEVLEMRVEDFGDLNVVGLPGRTSSRVNTWHNVLISMQKRTKALVAVGQGRPPADPFPSLVIGPDGIQARGSYAEAQESNASMPTEGRRRSSSSS